MATYQVMLLYSFIVRKRRRHLLPKLTFKDTGSPMSDCFWSWVINRNNVRAARILNVIISGKMTAQIRTDAVAKLLDSVYTREITPW